MSLFGKEEKEILSSMGYKIVKNLSNIKDFIFPKVVIERAKKELDITDSQMKMVVISLKDYFVAAKKYKNIEMIDKEADVLWHVFLLDTREYIKFCSQYLGFYLHHEPYLEDKLLDSSQVFDIHQKYNQAIIKDTKYSKYRQNETSRSNDDCLAFLMIGTTLNSGISDSGSSYSSDSSSSSCSSSSCSSSSCGGSC